MTRIIAVTNQKGGVGKTTTTINLGASLARMHRRVLLVDLDPQANATVGCGVDRVNLKGSSYQLLLDACTLRDAVVVVRDGLDLLPAESGLAGAQAELGGEQGNDNYRTPSIYRIVRHTWVDGDWADEVAEAWERTIPPAGLHLGSW